MCTHYDSLLSPYMTSWCSRVVSDYTNASRAPKTNVRDITATTTATFSLLGFARTSPVEVVVLVTLENNSLVVLSFSLQKQLVQQSRECVCSFKGSILKEVAAFDSWKFWFFQYTQPGTPTLLLCALFRLSCFSILIDTTRTSSLRN